MRFKHVFLALGLIAAPLLAFGASSINPTVPATNAPMSSAPIRNNFLAAYNDVNNIESKFGSTIAPLTPNTRQDWFDTTTSTAWNWKVYDGGQWVSIGTLNPTTHVWTAAVGGSVTSFSAGSTGLTPSSATAGAVTLAGILAGANGGTGVANTGKTITLGGNVSTSSTVSVTGALSTSAALSTTGAGATTLAFGASTQTYTFPTTTATIARTDAGQTFSGTQIFTGTLTTNVTGGGTQCAQVSNTGVLSGSGAGCGAAAPSAMMHLAAGTSIASNSVAQIIPLDTIDFDTAGICSAVSHVCTPTTAGKYRVTCRTQINGAGTLAASDNRAAIAARKNGSNASVNFSNYAAGAGSGSIAEAEVNGIITVNGSSDTIGCWGSVSFNVFSSATFLGNGDNVMIINYVGP